MLLTPKKRNLGKFRQLFVNHTNLVSTYNSEKPKYLSPIPEDALSKITDSNPIDDDFHARYEFVKHLGEGAFGAVFQLKRKADDVMVSLAHKDFCQSSQETFHRKGLPLGPPT